MSKLSKIEIQHIANLARIELSDKEKTKFSRELSEIFAFVEKLKRIDTKNISETSQVTGLNNVYRKDIASEATRVDKDKNKNREQMLRNAPDVKDEYIKTPAVLE